MKNFRLEIRKAAAAFMALMVVSTSNTAILMAEDIQVNTDPEPVEVIEQPAEEKPSSVPETNVTPAVIEQEVQTAPEAIQEVPAVAEEAVQEEIKAVEEQPAAVFEETVKEIKEEPKVVEARSEEVIDPAAAEDVKEEIKKAEPAAQTKTEEVIEVKEIETVNLTENSELDLSGAEAVGSPMMLGAVKMMAAPAAESVAETPKLAAAPSDKVTVHINNIIYSIHQIPYETSFTLSKGQTKTLSATGVLSYAGGKNYKTSYKGVNYTFQNVYALSTPDGGPVYWDENSEEIYVKKIKNNNDGTATVTFSNDTQEVLEEVYLSPVYKQDPKWLLEYEYVDNISTGSGSWSNLDAVESYSHTFKNPDEPEDYQFKYWQNETTNERYVEGETFTYTWTDKDEKFLKKYYEEHGELYKEEVVTNAYWQPAAIVNYYLPGNTKAGSVKEFLSNIDIYKSDNDAAASKEAENVTFDGWYKEDGTRLEAGDTLALPEVTKENNTTVELNVFAKYSTARDITKVWDDTDNRDGIRPASIQVQLYKNGEPDGEPITLSAENGWKYTFEKLNAYDENGNLIEYTIDEINVPNGYTKTVASENISYTITNSHTLNPVPAAGGSDDPDPDPTPGPVVTPNPEPVPDPEPAVVPPAGPQQPVVPAQVLLAEIEEQEAPLATPLPEAPAPAAPVEIEELDVPMAQPSAWALINLICAILTCFAGLSMGITFFRKHEEAIDEEEEEIRRAYVDEDEEETVNKRKASKFTGVILAIGSVVLFLLTEDMRNPMRLTDRWTIWMAVILAANLVLLYVTRNRNNEKLYLNANGGEGYMNPMIQEAGKDAEVPANEFSRSGYTFIGWNTEADGSGSFYEPNDSFRMEKNKVNKLYAQWAR